MQLRGNPKYCMTIHHECMKVLINLKKVNRKDFMRCLSQRCNVQQLPIERLELIINNCRAKDHTKLYIGS